MIFRVIPSAVLLAGAAYGSVLLHAEDKPASAVPNLGGRWVFNPELSDDARQKMREAREGMPGGGGAGGGYGSGGGMSGRGGGGMGGGGMGGHGGGMHGGGRGGPGADGREALRGVLEGANELTITPTETEVVILEKDGRMRILHPDGKGHKSEGGETEVKARWEGVRLVVETKSERGPRVSETYEVTPDRAKMTLTLRLEGGSMPAISLKRVYEPPEAREAATAPMKAPERKPPDARP